MEVETGNSDVAIIGMGPRGLGALEALASSLAKSGTRLGIDIFDPEEKLGAGPNFRPDESPLCLLNIPVRAVDIDPHDPSLCEVDFASFLNLPHDSDHYPARAHLGAYLEMRFDELSSSEVLHLRHIATEIETLEQDASGWWLQSRGGRYGPYREVLLTPGQPQSEPDPQLSTWQDHAAATGKDLLPAYPARDLLSAAHQWQGKNIAIRGLGLSTHDVLRMLTTGVGGRFEDGSYIPSGAEPARILPFSLNGHPAFPKPDGAAQDALYDPTEAETEIFEAALREAVGKSSDDALRIATAPLVAPVQRILSALSGDGDAEHWLAAERQEPGSLETDGPTETLRHGIAMAEGRQPPTPGYAAGQVWRKWQNALRRGFNSPPFSPATAETIIGFDEALKRYSYGPPVESSRELLILVEAGLVHLWAADDPDIETTTDGWSLTENGGTVTVSAMIDAVLPSPDISIITQPLLRSLIDDGLVRPVRDGLGAQIESDGQLVGRDGNTRDGLCLLGRMALGSIIAVDSIHDCFGDATRRWANGVVSRIG
ncbi:FAD/NAD(P)-binding protein [Algicella marina]|uniref:FAD-dependent urate hydroxylase HpyO/Asp monooxygenase CreE-like FAD/NAD(P)-binding domain-containing protein n=1 Tax=Algicella marina TaxID=2683284 RepID=A0A6P1T4Q3_9RHOB|nr:FAD/NAD(P)-binding protein [Algicella marina]QHQ35522.1 hypothetical protein GO499_10155 [Algicella marina]